MSEEIVNRVQKSGLVTIDMDDIELPKKISELDIKCWLSEGLFLKEKEYRNNVLSHDWSKYKNSTLLHLAIRSKKIRNFPGLYDNLIAGGQPSKISIIDKTFF